MTTSRVILVPVADGPETVAVELDERDIDGSVALAADDGQSHLRRASTSMAASMRHIRPAIGLLAAELRDAAGPTEVEVKFALKFGGETGIFIAKGSAEGAFEVTFRWSPEHGSTGDAAP